MATEAFWVGGMITAPQKIMSMSLRELQKSNWRLSRISGTISQSLKRTFQSKKCPNLISSLKTKFLQLFPHPCSALLIKNVHQTMMNTTTVLPVKTAIILSKLTQIITIKMIIRSKKLSIAETLTTIRREVSQLSLRLSTSPLLANMASGRIHCAWKLTPLNGQCFMIKTMPGLSLSWTLIAEAVRGSFLSGRNSSPKKALAHLMSNLATLTFPERSTRT